MRGKLLVMYGRDIKEFQVRYFVIDFLFST